MPNCAFIGLGVMGHPMAGHLQAAGHATTVYNRTSAKADSWVAEHGGTSAATPREAATGAEAVMVCVGNDDDLRSVIFGDDGVLAGMASGSTLIDHTTASAEVAREIRAAADELSVMCGGDDDVFARVDPLMQSYAKATVLVGGTGAGQLTKMVNQICIGGLIQGLSEALDFSRRAGLDIEKVLSAISQGASGSWQMENRARTMTDRHFDHGFALDWMRKDFGLVFDEAERIGAHLPITTIVDGYYARLQADGHGRWDTSSLIELLADD